MNLLKSQGSNHQLYPNNGLMSITNPNFPPVLQFTSSWRSAGTSDLQSHMCQLGSPVSSSLPVWNSLSFPAAISKLLSLPHLTCSSLASALLPSKWFHVPCHPYTPVFRQQILLDFWVFSFSSAQDNSITTTWFIFLNKISMIKDFFSKPSHRSWLLPTSSTNSESGFQSPSKLHEHVFSTS